MAYIYDLTDTWNAGGTTFNAIKMNVTDSASAAGSKLVTLQTNGTEHFSVTKAGVGYFSGSLGIGTSSPGEKLTVAGPETGNLADFSNGVNANFLIKSTTQLLTVGPSVFSSLAFQTNSTERMRIDSSGNVMIGTTAANNKFLVTYANPVSVPAAGAGGHCTAFGTVGYGLTTGAITNGNAYLQATRWDGTATNYDLMLQPNGGNVGIGTTSPANRLQVSYTSTAPSLSSDAGSGLSLVGSSTLRVNIGSDPSFPFGGWIQASNGSGSFFPLNLNPLGGNVGIGTSSPAQKLSVNGNIVTTGEIAFSGADFIYSWAGGTTGQRRAGFYLDGSNQVVRFYTAQNEVARINSAGNVGIGTSSPTDRLTVVSGDIYQFAFKNSSASSTGALGYNSTNDMLFNANGAERMRIDSSGNLLVGTTVEPSGVGTSGVMVQDLSGTAGRIFLGKTASGSVDALANYHDGTYVGGVVYSNTATSFPTSSDERLKHDIVDAPDAADLIDAIKVRSFKWNADNSEQRYGMIAQELLEVAPEAVSRPADPEEMMGVDYSKLVPMLVKEIQSLRARVAQLEGN